MKQTCILVLGMHRSGTSALTGVLSLLDVYLGSELMKANFANEKGYFENNILYRINEKLLAQINSSWDDTFYDEEKLYNIKDVEELRVAIKSEFQYAETFSIKDPRLAFLFPIYKQVLNELDINIKIILPYRNPIEIATSLNKRNGMPLEKGLLLWAYHFLLAEKFSRGYNRVFVEFDKLITDTSPVIDTISSKLFLNFKDKYNQNKKEIDAFLEPSLKHHNISMDNLSDNTPKIVKDILTLKDKFNNTDLSKEFDELRYELFSYQKLFYNASIVSSLDEGQRAKQALHVKNEEQNKTQNELNQTKENLTQKEQELNQTKQALHVKNEEQNKTQNELNQTKENLTQKEQELNQTKQALHVKNEEQNKTQNELNQTKENLTQKEQELNQTKQALHVKNEEQNKTQNELNQTKENLTQKEQELNQTKQALHVKNEEQNKTQNELNQTKQELDDLKTELTNIYISKSWKLTRPLRRLMRIVKK